MKNIIKICKWIKGASGQFRQKCKSINHFILPLSNIYIFLIFSSIIFCILKEDILTGVNKTYGREIFQTNPGDLTWVLLCAQFIDQIKLNKQQQRHRTAFPWFHPSRCNCIVVQILKKKVSIYFISNKTIIHLMRPYYCTVIQMYVQITYR